MRGSGTPSVSIQHDARQVKLKLAIMNEKYITINEI